MPFAHMLGVELYTRMKNGAKPTRINHKDYDYLKSFGAISLPSFPDSYMTDPQLWCPNQELPDPVFKNPALPYGCTLYSTADLGNDYSQKLVDNPILVENITHANENGGGDIRTALNVGVSLKFLPAFYNIQASAPLDYFDAIRLAIVSGDPEKRSVSWGTPWYTEWETAAYAPTNPSAIMPAPKDYNNLSGLPWHNSKICGFTTIQGVPYLINKSWQGDTIGDHGFLYFPRDVVNSVMTVQGTVAFIVTDATPQSIQTVSVSVVEWIVSLIKNLLGIQ